MNQERSSLQVNAQLLQCAVAAALRWVAGDVGERQGALAARRTRARQGSV